MNIYKIKSRRDLLYAIPKNTRILECGRDEKSGIYTLELYNPSDNTLLSIGKDKKHAAPDIVKNTIWKSGDVYYATIGIVQNKEILNIYKYNIESADEKLIYVYSPDSAMDEKIRVDFFILSESFMLVQKEKTIEENGIKRREFSQVLANLDTGEEIEVTDENIVKNGIYSIIPVSKTQIMIKTGFRYDETENIKEPGEAEKNVPIEAVFLNTPQKFIADLSLRNKTMDMQLIYSAFYDKYILGPEYKEGFVYLTAVNTGENSSESIFYNIATQENFTCVNRNIDPEKPNAAYIINKTPYARSFTGKETVFLNLRTMEFDISCMEFEFLDIVGKLLIAKSGKNGKILAFRCPDLKMVMSEKGNYRLGCTNNNDCYLYF